MNAPETPPTRLTRFSQGGGCGCKIAPGLLREILGNVSSPLVPKALLVGTETSDDAAVWQVNENQAIVATTDFFTPIVDDPADYGAIAAANALSDLYAMGATPLFALAVVGMPVDALSVEVIRAILGGGEAICARAGIPVAGGHTIDSAEPIYGLAAIGIVDPRRLKRNGGARPGDRIIIGKPLGVGIFSAALKRDRLSPEAYATMVTSATRLNTPGIALGAVDDVHAMTDVTGFGLLGHLLEVCRASGAGARVDFSRVPVHPGALELARSGVTTGASLRNWTGYGADVRLGCAIGNVEQSILTDPQTSGGLLVACTPQSVPEVLAIFRREGFDGVADIGEFDNGPPVVHVG